jgi:hypothetical protein
MGENEALSAELDQVYSYEVGVLDQVPVVVDKVWPTLATPPDTTLKTGTAVFTGEVLTPPEISFPPRTIETMKVDGTAVSPVSATAIVIV